MRQSSLYLQISLENSYAFGPNFSHYTSYTIKSCVLLNFSNAIHFYRTKIDEVTKTLLIQVDNGWNANSKCVNGYTATSLACRENHLGCLKILLDYGSVLDNQGIAT